MSAFFAVASLLVYRLAQDKLYNNQYFDLKITALEAAPGQPAEVWLNAQLLPDEISKASLLQSAEPAGSWIEREGALLSFDASKRPASISWSGYLKHDSFYFHRRDTLHFAKNRFSGRINIEVNGVGTTYDLFSEEPSSQIIVLSSILGKSSLSASKWLFANIDILTRLFTLFAGGLILLRLLADPKTRRKHAVIYAGVLMAGTYIWLSLTLYGARQDIAIDEIPRLFLHIAMVLAMQIALLFALPRFAKGMTAVFLALNSYFLYLILSSIALSSPAWLIVAILCLTIGFYLAVLDLSVRFSRQSLIALPLIIVVIVSGAILSSLMSSKAAPQSVSQSAPAFAGIRTVEFTTKPNVYFLSFDGMLPAVLTEKYVGFRPKYADALTGQPDVLHLRNMFSDAPNTKATFNQILRLRPNGIMTDDDLVVGLKPSPLREIFRQNGYETYFSFPIDYFGREKGPYLDHYWIEQPYSTCSLLKGNAKDFAFFGFCSEPSQSRSRVYSSTINWVTDRLLELRKSGRRPFFFMHHFLFPAHTYNNLATKRERDDFREFYEQGSDAAYAAITNLIGSIRTNDPTAIIFIYSDHGAWTSRAINLKDDPARFIQDRYGIFAAMINADHCKDYFRPPEGQTFQTNSRIVTSLIQCLANGKSPLTSPFDYNAVPQYKGEIKYQDYVYE